MQQKQSGIGPILAVLAIAGGLLGLAVSGASLLDLLVGRAGMLAAAGGAAVGALWAVVIHQGRRIKLLEDRLTGTGRPDSAPAAQPATDASKAEPRAATPESGPPDSTSVPAAIAQEAAAASRQPQSQSNTDSIKPRPPSPAWQHVKRWFTRGNVPVKIGVLVSFVGLAALLRYAGEQGWLSVPVELRLLGIALLAIAGLVFGARQVGERRVFALSLQGGAIGVLLLTIFAALRLYELMPASVAFSLMVVLVAAGGVLAVFQQALALAVLSMIAGFAAPLLVSTGEGSHVALFSWYAVLNLAVFAMAWRQSWPVLNRIGFVFTFAIATLWGVLAWSPAHYPSAQAFLILFFGLYFLIPIIEARHGGQQQSRWLDAILVFGLPLFAFPLQMALLEGEPMGIAYSALIAALVYLASSVFLLRRWNNVALGRSHAVLAVGLATLAVPFAFSESSITLIWALEGAALVWFGCLQQRRLPRLAGIALQAMAAGIWLLSQVLVWSTPDLMVLNKFFLAGLALAAAGLISAWRYDLAGANRWRVNALLIWALVFWFINGVVEIDRHLDGAVGAAALIAFAAASALLAAFLHFRKTWAPMGLAAALFMGFCVLVLPEQLVYGLPLAGWGALAWLLVVIAALGSDYCFGRMASRWRGWTTLAGHGAIVAVLSVTAVELASTHWHLGDGWRWMLGALPVLLLAAWLLIARTPPIGFGQVPATEHAMLSGFTVMVLAVGLALSLGAPGVADPLPWIPVINPLELAQSAAVILLLAMARLRASDRFRLPMAIPALLGLMVVTQFGLRSVHHLAGVDWNAVQLLASNIGQATLSVTWTVLGVLAWVAGSRWRHAAVWWAGAILLGLVLLKLLLIDRQFLSTVAGILSFLAFGMLSILVGYLAPAPPMKESDQSPSS